jgi:outer membrane receptor protein involved in Fe transport
MGCDFMTKYTLDTQNKKLLSLAVAAAVGFSGMSYAQDSDDEAESARKKLEEVVVVGSRIKRDGYSSASPIEVVSPELATVQGIADVGSLLQSTTVASGSPQVTAATSSAFVQEGGIGTSTISLRGLGATRTLVLLNGRRIGPAGVRGQVSSFDLNLMPLVAVERIEILKDGASTIYGSDAVAGVVNVITRRDEGLSMDYYTSQPADNGGEQSRLSLRWGKSSDRSRFSVMGDFIETRELRKGARDYFNCGEQYVFDPDTGERSDTIDPRTGSAWCNDLLWGHVWLYDYSGGVPSNAKAQFDFDGDLANYIDGFDPAAMQAPAGWFPVAYDEQSISVTNADHPFQDGASLVPKTEVFTLYADGEIDITDDMTLYSEAILSRRETYVNSYRQFWTYVYNEDFDFGYFYGYQPQGSSLSTGWRGLQWLSPTPITDHADDSVEVNYARALVGLSGEFKGYSWDVSAQYSRSSGDYISDQIYNDSIEPYWLAGGQGFNLFGSQYGSFPDGSCVGTQTPLRGADCVDPRWLDPDFNAGNFTAAERDFLFGRETGETEYIQWSLEGTISGHVMDLPAGEVLGAVGFHYRQDEIEDVPGEITLANNAWGASAAGITKGRDITRAVYGEIEIPVLTDLPGVHSLTVNASGRWTDVASYGNDTTYKVGLNWEVTPTLRVRASDGTSFRTPALFELYLADQTSFLRQRAIEPCANWGDNLAQGAISQRLADNCAADGIAPDFTPANISATAITGGGKGILEAETSTARTIGIVWQPEFTNLSISADYFDITIEDQVSQLGAGAIVGACYSSEFFPNDPLCDLFERRVADQGLDNIRDSYINVAEQRNRGWDLSATWVHESDFGIVTLETQHTFQIEDTVALFEETSLDSNGEIGNPKWTGRASATLQKGPWTASWTANIIGDADNYDSFGGNTATLYGREVRVVLDVDRFIYHNASVSYQFENGMDVRFGVANVFDKVPPRLTTLNLGEVSTQGNSAFYSQYDWEGRSYFLNVRYEM